MLRISRTLPLRSLRSTRSTGNLQVRALTSPAAAALEGYRPQQSYQQDHHHHNHHQYTTNRLQNRAVHVSTIQNDPFLQTSSSPFPAPPPLYQTPSPRPKTSATIFLSSLQRGGIEITPFGSTALSQILSPVPYTSVTPDWLRAVESAILTSHLNSPTENRTNRPTGKNLQPSSSKRQWKEWVKYQVEALVDRFVAMEGWDAVWNFEYLVMDEGLVVNGDEDVRRILEVLVRNGWVVPVEEEGDEGVYEVVSPGKVGRFEGDKFAF